MIRIVGSPTSEDGRRGIKDRISKRTEKGEGEEGGLFVKIEVKTLNGGRIRIKAAAGQELEVLPAAGVGVDLTQFRTTLRLSPAGRLARAAQGAKALRQLRSARRVT